MAILKVCCVRDAKVDAFTRPVFVPHVGYAVRSFGDEVARKQDATNGLAMHPEDYELFLVGEFDESNGVITPCAAQSLCRGLDFVCSN